MLPGEIQPAVEKQLASKQVFPSWNKIDSFSLISAAICSKMKSESSLMTSART
jgi:hypothetical protein